MSFLDLHLHSNRSLDGEVPAAGLVALAARAGIRRMAVADHNTTAGVAEAVREGERIGVAVIPAVELDCRIDGADLHVLGYGVDAADPRYADLDRQNAELERQSSGLRAELVRGLGLAIDGSRLAAAAPDGIFVGELLAEIALADPANADNPLLSPYRSGGDRSDNPLVNFYWDYCSRGKPAFVEIARMSLTGAVRLIADTGGVPVLAHPGVSLRGREALLDDILAAGVRGIEAFSGYHTPAQAVFWRRSAEKRGIGYTCGSDFHGKTKPAIAPGRHGGDEWEGAVEQWLGAHAKIGFSKVHGERE